MLKAKKFSLSLLSFLIISMIFSSVSVCAAAFVPDTEVHSEGVYMVNLDTGIVIVAQNEHERYYPASTTKIMTCIVAMEHIADLDAKVIITYDANNEFWEGDPNKSDVSNCALEAGQENITFRDCLYGLMVPSGCDAANVLALNISGSIPEFVELMNQKAQEIGCTGTHFSNAHGLWEADNYSTPYDMYLISRYAYDNVPGFMEICDTQSYDFPPNEWNPDGYTKYTSNPLITPSSDFYLDYVHGIKTGSIDYYYDEAGTHDGGRCLVSTARKNGYNYMLVTMQAPYFHDAGESYNYSALDHYNLYEWALNNFVYATVVPEGSICAEVDVEQGEEDRLQLVTDFSFSTLLPNELAEAIAEGGTGPIQKKVTYLYEQVIAPVTKGEVLAQMDVIYQDEVIATMDLVAVKSVERSQLAYVADRARSLFDTSWFLPLIALLIVLILTVAVLMVIRRRRLVREAKRKARRAARSGVKYR